MITIMITTIIIISKVTIMKMILIMIPITATDDNDKDTDEFLNTDKNDENYNNHNDIYNKQINKK